VGTASMSKRSGVKCSSNRTGPSCHINGHPGEHDAVIHLWLRDAIHAVLTERSPRRNRSRSEPPLKGKSGSGLGQST
jgi:hypothetical protein